MSIHLDAQPGDYAATVLMPGDPSRAKWIAETFLHNPVQVNSVRGCLGYTGLYNQRPVSVQASGMGQPSLAIYATELFEHYGVKNIIRVGTCGSLQPTVELGHIVLAMTAFTDSSMFDTTFKPWSASSCCSYPLLEATTSVLKNTSCDWSVGAIVATDSFYHSDSNRYKVLQQHGVLAVDMETHALYTLAMRYGQHALTVNTVSDNLCSQSAMTVKQKESGLTDMISAVLDSL